jgi:hypothetical protein
MPTLVPFIPQLWVRCSGLSLLYSRRAVGLAVCQSGFGVRCCVCAGGNLSQLLFLNLLNACVYHCRCVWRAVSPRCASHVYLTSSRWVTFAIRPRLGLPKTVEIAKHGSRRVS